MLRIIYRRNARPLALSLSLLVAACGSAEEEGGAGAAGTSGLPAMKIVNELDAAQLTQLCKWVSAAPSRVGVSDEKLCTMYGYTQGFSETECKTKSEECLQDLSVVKDEFVTIGEWDCDNLDLPSLKVGACSGTFVHLIESCTKDYLGAAAKASCGDSYDRNRGTPGDCGINDAQLRCLKRFAKIK